MAAVEIDEKKMNIELLDIYVMFLKNPYDSNTIDRIVAYDRAYGNLAHYASLSVKQPVSKETINAINLLSVIYQFNMGTYDNQELIKWAKEVVEDLKKVKEKFGK